MAMELFSIISVADRARELTHAFTDTTFDGFARNEDLKVPFVTMTQYEKGMNVEIAYKPEALTNTLGEYVSKLGSILNFVLLKLKNTLM